MEILNKLIACFHCPRLQYTTVRTVSTPKLPTYSLALRSQTTLPGGVATLPAFKPASFPNLGLPFPFPEPPPLVPAPPPELPWLPWLPVLPFLRATFSAPTGTGCWGGGVAATGVPAREPFGANAGKGTSPFVADPLDAGASAVESASKAADELLGGVWCRWAWNGSRASVSETSRLLARRRAVAADEGGGAKAAMLEALALVEAAGKTKGAKEPDADAECWAGLVECRRLGREPGREMDPSAC